MTAEKIVFRDLTEEEVEVKKAKGGLLLLYKTARVDANILDETFGTLGWQKLYEELDGKVYCKIGVKIDGEWIWKMDCGEETAIEAAKGEASDAMKRAGFAFGIGRKLYNSPRMEDPDPGNKNAKYNVYQIEFDKTSVSSLWITDDKNKTAFYYGNFEQHKKKIAFDFLEGNAVAKEYYLKQFNKKEGDLITDEEWVEIYNSLKKNNKVN